MLTRPLCALQVPVQRQVRVPRQYMEQQTVQYQVPKVEYQDIITQVPRTVMVPQTTFENHITQMPRETFEIQTVNVQIPRMTEEVRNVVSYEVQNVQEPVQIMVPQTETVNTVQQVNRVVEYARVPVRQYSVPGEVYTDGPSMGYTPYAHLQYGPTVSYAQDARREPLSAAQAWQQKREYGAQMLSLKQQRDGYSRLFPMSTSLY
jgi:hypothetical protein